MVVAEIKKHLSLIVSITALIAVGVAPAVSADTFPFLKLQSADTWDGGWFEQSGACNNGDPNYQDQYTTATQDNGGVATFTGTNSSSESFGSFSLGLVDAASGSPTHGYITDFQGAKGNNLTFSNAGSSDGLFQGAQQQQHCVPDYYGTKQLTAPAPTDEAGALTINVGSLNSQQYIDNVPAGVLNLSGTIANNQHTTLFVNGDVYISGNITYAAGYTEANVPKFALVVKGNIFVAPTVTQIDGWYIAQPDTTSAGSIVNTGEIWTCHDNTTATSLLGPWIESNCKTNLTVNGALTAKRVDYLRAGGDVNTAASSASETLNYTPAMVVGGPFFNPNPPTSLPIESLITLPPLYQ